MTSQNEKMPALQNDVKAISKNSADAKRDVTTTNGGAKLSSLTPARDLTLGGRGASNANKKVFMPNLNVVRNKNTNVKTSKDTTIQRGRGRGRGTDRSGSGRGGRGGASSSLIQTTGVFSEGAGAMSIRKAISHGREVDDSPSAMRKPTIFKAEKKMDLKSEIAKDNDILSYLDEDIKDDDDIKTDFARMPVQLNEAKWINLKSEIKVESSKTDSSALPEDALAIAAHMQAMHVNQQAQRLSSSLPRYPRTVSELLDDSQTKLFLMQLPDTLPSVDEDDKSTMDTAERGSDSNQSENKQKPDVQQQVLKKMDEGQVGRIVRYKSGKTKLILGETYFDLDIGMETGFLQDLMSINCNREERSGNMINLGPIQAKITVTPDWEHILKQAHTTVKE